MTARIRALAPAKHASELIEVDTLPALADIALTVHAAQDDGPSASFLPLLRKVFEAEP